MLALRYLPANAAYCFTFGGPAVRDMQLTRMGDYPMFYQTRREAIEAARSCGLVVFQNGAVAVHTADTLFA